MLKLIEGSYASFFPKEIDAMFRNRAETFSDRLGWKVVVRDGYERDVFDDANPLYLVSVDPDTEEYWGSLRLLPTTGPNMLRDVFPHLLDGEYIESATIWGKFAHLHRRRPQAARTKQERRELCLKRANFGYRRSRSCGGPDANRQRVRRQDVPRLESRRIQSSGHRNPSTDRGRDVLRRSFRHWRGAVEGLSGRNRDRAFGSCSGRQGDCIRLSFVRAARRDRARHSRSR
jgi:hypothetical protein